MKQVGNNVYNVPIGIGKLKQIPMLFDTGASGVVINQRTLARYIASGGLAIKLDPGRVQVADGRIIEVDRYVLESLSVGKCTFKPAYVSITTGDNLFGAVLLRVMSPIVIDYKRKMIMLMCPDKIAK